MTMWPTDGELADMRAQVAELLPDTCVISAGTLIDVGGGNWEEQYAPVAGGTVSCRVDPLGRKTTEIEINVQQETLTTMFQLTVPYDAPVAENRRVAHDSRTYEIVQIDDMHSGRVSRRAVISEVR